jgi:hypothetical protein
MLEFDDVEEGGKTWRDPAPGFEKYEEEDLYTENQDDDTEKEDSDDEGADPETTDAEVEDTDLKFPSEGAETSGQKVKLIGMRCFDQEHVYIHRWYSQEGPMFGRPMYYRITIGDHDETMDRELTGSRQRDIDVHWSRIIHISSNMVNSEFIGTPACRPVVND